MPITRSSHKPRYEICALLLAVLLAPTLAAHDGGFGHSRRTLFVAATPDGLALEYRVVLSRDEALAEMAPMDADNDGAISKEEKDRWFAARGKQLAKLLQASADGDTIKLSYESYSLGSALSQTYRITLETKKRETLLEDRAFPHKPGLVQVRAGAGVKVEPAKPVNLAHAERVTLRILREK